MPTTPQTIYRHDYQVSNYLVETVNLTVELNDNCTTVTNTLVLYQNPAATTPTNELYLNGEALSLQSLHVDGAALTEADYTVTKEALIIHQLPERCELTIVTTCDPKANTELSGLYKSGDIFCTQCESHGFRRISYYLDRPDVLATFQTKIIASKQYPFLLSNGNLIEQGDADADRHYAVWQDPFKKPCYLFALVAGEFACLRDQFVTCSGRTIDLSIYVEPANEDKTAHAMWSLKQAMHWDEKHYGREYDLDIFMLVAVDDFNFGAMENKGLNIFNSKYVLADPQTATDLDYQNIAAVVAHEYFHNWSGNRVTCRDWFQLSLKEGLTVFRDQSFSETYFDRDVMRIADVQRLRVGQFAEDAGPMAHPVRPDSYVDINNFYTMTVYEKGAEVIRMQKQLLGAKVFRQGTDLYFERHDGRAVTCDDFVAALEAASGVDLTQFKRWYSQAGTPEVIVELEQDKAQQQVTLTVSQTCPPTPDQPEKAPFVIPLKVALFNEAGQRVPLQLQGESVTQDSERVLSVTECSQHFVFTDIATPVTPSLLRGFSAPIKLHYDYNEQQLAFLMQHEDDGFNRYEASFNFSCQQLTQMMNAHRAGAALVCSDNYLQALERIARQTDLDNRLKAQILTLPSKAYLAELGDCVDIEAIAASQGALRRAIANHLKAFFMEHVKQAGHQPYQFDAAGQGQRAMTALALDYLASIANDDFLSACKALFERADNMTDQMACLTALRSLDCSLRMELFDAFYQRWQAQPLVVDKWLRLQALAEREGTVEQVTGLLAHPAFSITNPNKVYALLMSFGVNLTQFHRADFSGYQLLANQIERLNTINAQVAARLLTPFTKWRRYDEARQQAMLGHLKHLAGLPDLAKQLYEVVHKCLD